MTDLTYIQGGPGWRRVWKRPLGPGAGAVTVLNGHAREYGVRDPEGTFSIKWIPQGKAVYRVDGASHALGGERMVMLNGGQPYELEFADRRGTESLCVFFSANLVAEAWADQERLGEAGVPQFPDLVFRPTIEVRSALARLRDGHGAPDPAAMAAEEDLLGLLTGLVSAARAHRRTAEAIPAIRPSTRRHLAGRLERARQMLEEETQAPSLDALARESGLSKFHLIRLFRAAFGCTPSAYAGRVRMTQARRLLSATPMTVAQIGEALGYESPSAFIRAFRRHFGTTPQAIRLNPVPA